MELPVSSGWGAARRGRHQDVLHGEQVPVPGDARRDLAPPIGAGDAEPRTKIIKKPGDQSSASHGAAGDPRHRHGRPTLAYVSPDIPVPCAQNRIICVRHEAHCYIARVAGMDWRRCLWI
jgi:hypothetical protein